MFALKTAFKLLASLISPERAAKLESFIDGSTRESAGWSW